MPEINMPKVCDTNGVEEIVIDYFCQYGFMSGISAEDFMMTFASFNEFLQDNYPDCILTPGIVEEWVSYRWKHGIPEMKS